MEETVALNGWRFQFDRSIDQRRGKLPRFTCTLGRETSIEESQVRMPYCFETIRTGERNIVADAEERFIDQTFEYFVNEEENIIRSNALDFNQNMPI
jgi:hypothetical protein